MLATMSNAVRVAREHAVVMVVSAVISGVMALIVSIVLSMVLGTILDVVGGGDAAFVLVSGLVVVMVAGLLVGVLAGAALGQDHHEDGFGGGDFPLWLAVFDLFLAYAVWVCGSLGADTRRLGMALRPRLMALSVPMLGIPTLVQTMGPGVGTLAVGGLGLSVYSLFVVVALVGDRDGWGVDGAWEVAREHPAATGCALVMGSAATVVMSGAMAELAFGTELSWLAGAVVATCMNVGLIRTVRPEWGQVDIAASTAPAAAKQLPAFLRAAEEGVASPTEEAAAPLHGNASGIAGPATPWGTWIWCSSPGTVTIDVGWSDPAAAQVAVANADGAWMELEALHEPGSRALTVAAGWLWVQCSGASSVATREVTVAWRLQPVGGTGLQAA